MKWMPFQCECDHKYATLLSTKLMGNEQEDKTLDSEMVTLYTLCFVKQNCHYGLSWTDVTRCVMTIFLIVGGIL